MAGPDGRRGTRPLLAAVASEWVANWPCPSQGEDGNGMVMAEGPVIHGDDAVDDFEGLMRDGALECQLTSVEITGVEDLPHALFDQARSRIARNTPVEAWQVPLVVMYDCGVYL